MNSIEIPLLRESATYARRLIQAAQSFAESRYHFHRRINWSYRYSEIYYSHESTLFQAMPDEYIRGDVSAEPQLEDVYTKHLNGKQIFTVVMKVIAHTLFALVGRLADYGVRRAKVGIYRKAYVDDIELVYDPVQPSVVRAVYPFPINLQRQLRYLRFLHRQGYRFKLAGNPYGIRDFIRFLRQRSVRALMRMESRAQIRHARDVAALGVHTVQLSDEFDIGSLDFVRTLSRFGVSGENSAHGVGKYFPVHAYQTFFVLTKRQIDYYIASRHCTYHLRQLNDLSEAIPPNALDSGHDLVLLSQSFGGGDNLINHAETLLVQRLQHDLSTVQNLRLHYKPHPNHPNPLPPPGFALLKEITSINGRPGTVFLSFFSTCHIDPKFKGKKFLISANLIHPEISFDDTEEIVDIDMLISKIKFLNIARSPKQHSQVGITNE
jgi:hypothetical protein